MTAWPSTMPETPRPGTFWNDSTRRKLAGLRPGCGGDGPRDRVLRGVLERAGEPQHLRARVSRSDDRAIVGGIRLPAPSCGRFPDRACLRARD